MQIGADQPTYASPFYHYIGGQPLRNGFQWADIGMLAATASALVGLGAWRFARRDNTPDARRRVTTAGRVAAGRSVRAAAG